MPQLPQTLQDIIDTIVVNFQFKETELSENAFITYLAGEKAVIVEFDVELNRYHDKNNRYRTAINDYTVAKITLNTGEEDINIPTESTDIQYYIDDFYEIFRAKENVHFASDYHQGKIMKIKELKIGWLLKNITTGEILKVSKDGGYLYLKDPTTKKKRYCLAYSDSEKQHELKNWEKVA